MQSVERPHRLRVGAWTLIGALGALILTHAMALAFGGIHLSMLNELDRGVDVSYERVTASDLRLGIAHALQLLAYAAVVAAFLTWFYFAYRNLSRLGGGPPRYAPGWSIGAWFVPGLNLYRPKRMVDELWRGTAPEGARRPRRVSWLIHLWWAVWLLGLAAAVVTAYLFFTAMTVPEQRTATRVELWADGLFVVVSLVTMLMVRAVSRRHEAAVDRRLAALGPVRPAWGWAPPPWAWPAPPPPWRPPVSPRAPERPV